MLVRILARCALQRRRIVRWRVGVGAGMAKIRCTGLRGNGEEKEEREGNDCIPTVHIRNHVNLRLGLRNLLLRRDLWFLTEEHGHGGLKKKKPLVSFLYCELDRDMGVATVGKGRRGWVSCVVCGCVFGRRECGFRSWAGDDVARGQEFGAWIG